MLLLVKILCYLKGENTMSQMLALVICSRYFIYRRCHLCPYESLDSICFRLCCPLLAWLLDIFPARYRLACRSTARRCFDDDLLTYYEYGNIAVTSTTERTMENHFNFPCWYFRDCCCSFSESVLSYSVLKQSSSLSHLLSVVSYPR